MTTGFNVKGLLLRFQISGLLISFLGCAVPAEEDPEIEISENSISMRYQGKEVWKINHNPEEGKPYIHPLATVEGITFSDLRPKDHPWHRSLWFSWKFINGVNYWEEDRETGKSEGQTRLIDVDRTELSNGKVLVEMKLTYAPANTGKKVLEERRRLLIHPPDPSGIYRIDWSSVFQALENDVVLDRTPNPGEPGGQSWGGYAGYSLRMNQDVSSGVFANSEGQSGADANRQAAQWMTYSVPSIGSILFMDHPSNLRHPSKWYVAENMPYFSPAVIHDGPHTIPKGEDLVLQYRIAIASDTFDASRADREWKSWVSQH